VELVGIFILRKTALTRAIFFRLRKTILQLNAKTRRKIAGTYVALPKSHNVEITSKGGELDSNRTTSATVFTLRLRIASALPRAHGRVGTAESDGEGEAEKNFR